MTEKTITIKSKEEIKAISPDTIKFDIALKARMDSLDRTIKELTAEYDAVKKTAKAVFGKDGGNGVFSTETRISYILNLEELTELIGADKVEELKNKASEKTYVHW